MNKERSHAVIVVKNSILFPLGMPMLRATTKKYLWTDMMTTLAAWSQMLAHSKLGWGSMMNMMAIIMLARNVVQIVKI